MEVFIYKMTYDDQIPAMQWIDKYTDQQTAGEDVRAVIDEMLLHHEMDELTDQALNAVNLQPGKYHFDCGTFGYGIEIFEQSGEVLNHE